ncbi:T9SS type A sorting domain-containing protein [Neolewinella sp.]|uniref:T9SS type A sorting domain-containing protein n=1 Tax=Neolewinella sp. TaxID=2993543 RepID=UPI003B515DF4
MGSINTWDTYATVWSFLLLLFGSTAQASSVAPPGQNSTAYWLEAECATAGNRWTKVLSDEAAGGAYVETQFVSLASPPAATPENLIRFTVTDPPLDRPYRLLARVDAPSRFNDSYWLRINGGAWQELRSGFRIGEGFKWVELVVTELRSGTNTIDFTYRENSTRLDKILLTDDPDLHPMGVGVVTQECPQITPPPVDKGVFWLEAECAIVGSTWMPERDSAASNGIVLTSTRSSTRFEPPVDLPSNLIRFVIDDPDVETGNFSFWIRANLPDDDRDAFWVRFNEGQWNRLQPARIRGKGLAWAGYGIGRTLTPGRNTIDITFLDPGIQIDKILVTKYSIEPSFLGGRAEACPFTPAPEVTDRNTFWLEGECAAVGDKWSTEADPAASNGAAVVVRGTNATDAPPADELANFLRFNIAAADSGSYNLFARVKTPDNLSDSYWIRTNGGPWYEWARGFEFMDTYSWQQTPVAFTLQEGVNTLDIAFREDGAVLDKLFLTLTASEVTGDMLGDPASNCASEAALAEAFDNQLLIGRRPTALSLFPNPTSSHLSLQWQSEVEGPANLSITDARGRQVRNIVLSAPAGWLRQELDVSILPAGVYYLRILQDKQQIVQRFVKQ